jgi:hypothetical protein
MEDANLAAHHTFRYPGLYRTIALGSALLFGFIVLGCLLAVVDAIPRDWGAAALYSFGFLSGIAVILWGLDFATRSLALGPDGLHVRWLLRRSVVPWADVLGWRYRVLSLIHIRTRRGRGIFVWPLLENYTDLLNTIDAQRRQQLQAEALPK